MKTISFDERMAVVEALLDVAALLEALALVADFAAESSGEQQDSQGWKQRENAIASLPSLLRIMREKLDPVDHLVLNYDFSLPPPAGS